MSGPDNQFEDLARQAAKSIEASRDLAEQLSLLPDEQDGASLTPGKAARGKGKVFNQMREWLAQRGYRAPEDVLAEMAGLASREDAILTAMVQTERVLAWAGTGAVNRKFVVGVGHVEVPGPWQPTPDQKMDLFKQLYATMLRAADALMPYGAPKATPDVAVTNVNQIVVQSGEPASQPARPGDRARDVTPSARRIQPPPMPHQMQQNQRVSDAPRDGSDRADRTE
ncbi:hypothetical protein D2T31_00545 [Sinirhodobacter populi]|uniref:Uncharacterized protein n=1 Tax=Paenirhodobacter populi TaxID=2306993 RepID=A0A443KIF5_9RHOB|nr:hypothetical protein [Sinirhodobacter populi]RWR32506.1 hypothetical protein D2T31_00545 [Sinirhodobacter populi]